MASYASSGDPGSDDEDDYMSMVVEDPKSKIETSIQRAARRKKESEIKSRQKSKREKEEEERLAREAALASSLDSSNKGFKMLTKLGYKPGSALGKSGNAHTEPIHLSIKEGRGGVGMESEKKRKMRDLLEATERGEKKVKTDHMDYRERLRQEREDKRLEGQVIGAQKVAESLDIEAEEQKSAITRAHNTPIENRPLKYINVLYRGLIKERREREARERMRKNVQDSLTYSRPEYNASDDEENDDDKELNGTAKPAPIEFFEQDLEDEDDELEQFNNSEAAERLAQLTEYLRSSHLYCFWCKAKYPDADFMGCPGLTEEEHET